MPQLQSRGGARTGRRAEFARLREIIGVSDSLLSKHLSTLAEARHIALRKATADGRKAFKAHVAALEALVVAAR